MANPYIGRKVLYFAGIQRSATNYFEQLVRKNFEGFSDVNDGYARCLPLHKHFRLHDNKFLIPEPKYYNAFYYPDFNTFKDHVEELGGQAVDKFLVTIKNPYSWYLSYDRFARKNNFLHSRKDINSHFIFDYRYYYEKWLAFSKEAPETVKLFRYEDMIRDLNRTMTRVSDFTGLQAVVDEYENVKKVSMSRRFNTSRLSYYQNETYKELISQKDKDIINQILGEDFFHQVNYPMEK